MKFFILLLITFANLIIGAVAQDNPPSIKVNNNRGKQSDLITRSIDIEVSHMGVYAETEITFVFENKGNSETEAEFEFPIPKGAHLSQLWLSIGDSLRQSTSVPASKAKLAYETLTRRNIDPALVEYIDDTTFRTRLFPIPSNGTKTIKLAYIEELKRTKDQHFQSLPFFYEHKCKRFSLKITDGSSSSGKAKINKKEGKIDRTDLPINEVFTISFPVSNKKEIFLHDDGSSQFVNLQMPVNVPKAQPNPLAKAKAITIAWDVSNSMGKADKRILVQRLDALFAKTKASKIRLIPFGNGMANIIAEGSWEEVKPVIEKLRYSGGSLKDTTIDPLEKSIVMIVSDGGTTLPASPHFQNAKILYVKLGAKPAAERVIEFLRNTNASLIKATELKVENSFSPSYFPIGEHHIPLLKIADFQKKKIWAIPAKTETGIESFDLHLSGEKLSLDLTKAKAHPMAARVWAWQQANFLQKHSSKQKLIDHATAHNLATKHTSLIVLDRIQDYLNYGIEPPKDSNIYKKFLAKKSKIAERKRRAITGNGKEINFWQKRQFLWLDHWLHSEQILLNTWLNATEIAFEKKQLEKLDLAPFKKWQNEAEKNLTEHPPISQTDARKKWDLRVAALAKKRKQLSAEKKNTDQAPAVSVRGRVRRVGTYQFSKPATLMNAIKLAKPELFEEELSRVALYRNGSKTIYNPQSKDYTPVFLKHGDMLVVESRFENDIFGARAGGGGGLDDIFGAPEDDEQEESAASEPAIIENSLAKDLGFSQESENTPFPQRTELSEPSIFSPSLVHRLHKNHKLQRKYKLPAKANTIDIYQGLRIHYPHSKAFYSTMATYFAMEDNDAMTYECLINAIDLAPSDPTLLMLAAKLSRLVKNPKSCKTLRSRCINRLKKIAPKDPMLLWEETKTEDDLDRLTLLESLQQVYTLPDSDFTPTLTANDSNDIFGDSADSSNFIANSLISLSEIEIQNIKRNQQKPPGIKALEADIKIELDSLSPSVNVSFSVITPASKDIHIGYEKNPNNYGELFYTSKDVQGFNQTLYLNKRALPGTYEITVHHPLNDKETDAPFPVVVTITNNWNRKDEKVERINLLVDPSKGKKTLLKSMEWDLK